MLAIDVNRNEIFDVPRGEVTRIAVGPSGVDTGEFADSPQNYSGLQPWAMGMMATILGDGGVNWVNDCSYGKQAYEQQVIPTLDGPIRDIVESMSGRIFGSMRVDDSRDKGKVVGPLLGLKRELGHLNKESIEAFLWSTDWSGSNIKTTLEFMDKINDGRNLMAGRRKIQPVDYSQKFAGNDY